MKPNKYKIIHNKRRRAAPKKNIGNSKIGKPRKSESRDTERARFKKTVDRLRKTRSNLEKKVQQRNGKLKIRDGQLKEHRKDQKQAKAQIHIFNQAIESTADGVFIIDVAKPDYPIIYVNPSFLKITGYTQNNIIGRNYLTCCGSYADKNIVKEIKQSVRSKKPFYGEMITYRKNGEKSWALLRIVPVHDFNGSVTHLVGIQTDITFMKQEELEIKKQRDELLHVTRVGKLAEFVSSLAHEISQPLTAILSYAQTAQRMLAGKEPKLREIIQYIIDDDQRAVMVIQRLHSLLKKGKPEMKPLDINMLIRETVMLIATDAAVRSVVIKTELDADLSFICGDRVQLQQVFLNLISNSFDALGDSKGERKILIRTSRKDTDTIIVEAKDSGCGISTENISKLFTNFFTSKPDGLGMGLSISRSIIEAHGGRLDVKNNPDCGVTFYFSIPVYKKDT